MALGDIPQYFFKAITKIMLIAVAAAFRDLPHFHCAAQYQLSRRLDPFFGQQVYEAGSGLLLISALR